MKKHYFNSKFGSLIYLVIAIILIGYIVFCCFADEIHSGVIFAITFLSISVTFILFWFGFSLSMRIQIDYEKKELYIRQPYFIRKIKFEEIQTIQIIDYNEVAFDFIIVTNNYTKRMAYARYIRSKPSNKVTTKLNEIKNDLMKIVDKNI